MWCNFIAVHCHLLIRASFVQIGWLGVFSFKFEHRQFILGIPPNASWPSFWPCLLFFRPFVIRSIVSPANAWMKFRITSITRLRNKLRREVPRETSEELLREMSDGIIGKVSEKISDRWSFRRYFLGGISGCISTGKIISFPFEFAVSTQIVVLYGN